jgi:hypothetical protein
MMDAAFGSLSDEALGRMVLAERQENAEARREQRERDARIHARQQDIAQQVQLGLRTVRSPSQVLADFAAAGDAIDQNNQRCRAVLDRWLVAGGRVEELKDLLGDRATQAHARMEQQRSALRRRAEQAEAQRDARDARILALEREVSGLRFRAERLEGAVGGEHQGAGRAPGDYGDHRVIGYRNVRDGQQVEVYSDEEHRHRYGGYVTDVR